MTAVRTGTLSRTVYFTFTFSEYGGVSSLKFLVTYQDDREKRDGGRYLYIVLDFYLEVTVFDGYKPQTNSGVVLNRIRLTL